MPVPQMKKSTTMALLPVPRTLCKYVLNAICVCLCVCVYYIFEIM